MQIQDIKPGDVLLFSGLPNDIESLAIMYLTEAPVCHAALAYKESGQVIDEMPPKVGIYPMVSRFKDQAVYVRRRKGDLDLEPVLDAATQHYEQGNPAGDTHLYLIAFLLVFKPLPSHRSPAMQMLVTLLLKRLTGRLMDYVERTKVAGKQVTFCTLFAFQCFKDAGPIYRLTVEPTGTFIGPFLSERTRPKSLLDIALAHLRMPANVEAVTARMYAQTGEDLAQGEMTDAMLLQEILRVLQEEGQTASETLDHSLVAALARFAQVAYTAVERTVPTPENALAWLRDQQATFVTPGDLLKHCPDLETVGVIERI